MRFAMRLCFLLSVVFVVGMQGVYAANKPTPKTAPIDTAAIQQAYSEGEFEIGIKAATETWIQGSGLQHSDSLFLCKYLAVMLGADPDKRENSKYYMNQILLLDTSTTVMDLYATDAIYSMFATVKTEFLLHQKKVSQPAKPALIVKSDTGNQLKPVVAAAPIALPPPPAQAKPAKTSWIRSKWVWAASGSALVGVGVGFVTLMSSEPAKSKQVVLPVSFPSEAK
jgi:hypothetical protein